MLAATRLIALHKNKGMTVAACLKNRTDYIENPDKTEQGQFVSNYACSALTADEEFMLTKRQYDLVNGRRQKNDVIAYQIRQSFRPGEITAEEANKVGYELAMRFTKGKHRKMWSCSLRRTRAISDRSIPDKRIPSRTLPIVEVSSAAFLYIGQQFLTVFVNY